MCRISRVGSLPLSRSSHLSIYHCHRSQTEGFCPKWTLWWAQFIIQFLQWHFGISRNFVVMDCGINFAPRLSRTFYFPPFSVDKTRSKLYNCALDHCWLMNCINDQSYSPSKIWAQKWAVLKKWIGWPSHKENWWWWWWCMINVKLNTDTMWSKDISNTVYWLYEIIEGIWFLMILGWSLL